MLFSGWFGNNKKIQELEEIKKNVKNDSLQCMISVLKVEKMLLTNQNKDLLIQNEVLTNRLKDFNKELTEVTDGKVQEKSKESSREGKGGTTF